MPLQSTSTAENYAPYLLALLLESPTWVHRRVEQVELVDDRTVFHSVSTDLSLGDCSLGKEYVDLYAKKLLPQLLIPVGLLDKRPLECFNLRDSRGGSLSLFTQRETTPMATQMMLQLAKQEGYDAEPLRRNIEAIVDAQPPPSVNQLAGWPSSGDSRDNRELAGALWEEPAFRFLLTHFAAKFLAVAICPSDYCSDRKLLKFSYTTPLPWRRLTPLRRLGASELSFSVPLPLVRLSASYHVEVQSPEGTDVLYAQILRQEQIRNGRAIVNAPDPEDCVAGPRSRAHLYVQDQKFTDNSEYMLTFQLILQRRGLVRSAFVTTLFTAIVLAVLWIFRTRVTTEHNSAAAFLLIIPGLAAAYISRPNEHAAASRMCLGLRSVVSLAGACALTAAGVLNLSVSPWVATLAYGACTVVAVACLLVALVTYAVTAHGESAD